MLTAMGFPTDQASTALRECGGNIEQAANWLLSAGGSGRSAVPPTANDAVTSTGTTTTIMIHGALHQYNVDNGKSACTCIALTAAELFLQQQQQQQQQADNSNQQPALDSTFLQNAVLQGVEKYNTIMATGGTGGVEHLSAEEVLQTKSFPRLELHDGGVLQGMLSPAHGPLSLQVLIPASQYPTQWTCVIITKPPETVLCCLPPNGINSNNTSNDPLPFLLVDSHPRPQPPFGAEGSYIRKHATATDLVQSLERLFPVTQLGPDIPEWMAAMYNQFDLYRLRLAQP